MTRCQRCKSTVCDGRTVACLGCGVVQCHGNGLGRGACSVCHFGILPGWSSWRRTCGYKGCTEQAAFHDVPGSIKAVCHTHAARPKVSLARSEMRRIALTEYIATLVARRAHHALGVVPPGEQSVPWPLFLSEADEQSVTAIVTRARDTYKPFT